ncbi:Uncharacterized membrane protein YeiB [Amycolatopsis arida]|uniref:Uncharacterized membrane protein YeiB n=1 Tax=Amycolatopsis arida TaxID=587909 RepID=A0A1I6AR23_9PSEU|nr:heparan-alpha-glucosaminide N-acetyltransferase domain-containing protein [Amycolatopsis arida]TDX97595.1 putative membrane protein YeiB [Amycolatopsis arida]SFQ71178.1 Uncharacterized membrane protein YeiB [Amycolatopsis arida]
MDVTGTQTKRAGTSLGPGHRLPRGRLLGIDAVRALAIIGVFVEHFYTTGWLHAGRPEDTPGVLQWVNEQTSSRAMSLFVLLAGVSVALMTGGHRPFAGRDMSTARRRVAVRALALFLISLGIDEFGASVLSYYAVLLLLLIPLTRLRPRTLLTAAGLAAPLVTAYAWWVMSAHRDWMMVDAPSGLAVLTSPGRWGEYLVQLVLTGGGFQTVYGIPLVLAGLAIGRLDLHDHAVRSRLLRTGLGVAATTYAGYAVVWHGLGAGADVAAAMAAPGPSSLPWQSLLGMPTDGLYATSPLGIVFMIGVAMALLGGMLLLLERRVARTVLWPLVAAGGMTMTWYAGHFAYLASIGDPSAVSFVHFATAVAVLLGASVLWRRWMRRGPLEWLVHTVVTTAVPGRR